MDTRTHSKDIKSIIIVGAGAAGLFAARTLQKNGIKVTLLEKEPKVGGKCKTYTDPQLPALKTEYGATLVAPNYGIVLQAIKETGVQYEENLPTERDTVDFYREYDKKNLIGKLKEIPEFVIQVGKFTEFVKIYQQSRDKLLHLPTDFEMSFADFAKKHDLGYVNTLLKSFVTGFGYGAMNQCPAYCVFEYMGLTTIPELLAGQSALKAIQQGFQHLMEEIAKTLTVLTSTNIQRIQRSAKGVQVEYTEITSGQSETKPAPKTLHADALILAISPFQWKNLGMELSAIEKQCVEKLTYYRYPVAICKIDNIPAEHEFFPAGLEPKGFGHLALITTRDKRPDPVGGRLATAYINLNPGPNNFSLDAKTPERTELVKELSEIKGVKAVEILDTKIWEDYMPTLPWDLRLTLEKEQLNPNTRTVYVGAYPAGGFEDVACVSAQAVRAANKYILNKELQASLEKQTERTIGFFAAKEQPPVGAQKPEPARKCCVIM